MIVLNNLFDKGLLTSILSEPQDVIQLPKELYNKYHAYLIQEERYEDVVILESVKAKVIDKPLNNFLGEVEIK